MKITTTLLGLALVGLASVTQSTADTKYVDKNFGPGGDGSKARPYNTIQAAIDIGFSDVVIVMPGTYRENLVIKKRLSLYGYDGPLTTRVDGSNGGDTITIGSGFTVTIEGLNLSSGRYGVSQPNQGILVLRNCIFCSNQLSGTYIVTSSGKWPVVSIYNCIYVANGGSGIYVDCPYGTGWYHPDLNVLNTVFMRNGSYAIESGNMVSYSGGGRVVHDYNDVVDNARGQYSAKILAVYPPGPNSFSLDPAFIGGVTSACNQDFRLLPSSPCKDKGDSGIGFLDPDGTRNDIGVYGGPGAARFYVAPNDGPMVREVTIDKGIVPKGESFTIRAKGAVR